MTETDFKSTWAMKGVAFWSVWIVVLFISIVELGASFAGFIDIPTYIRLMIDGSLFTLITIWIVDWVSE